MILKQSVAGWYVAIVFGVGLLIFLLQLPAHASYLQLDTTGIQLRSLYRTRQYFWKDIERITLQTIGLQEMVCIHMRKHHPQNYIVLPDTYGKTASELKKVLEKWHKTI